MLSSTLGVVSTGGRRFAGAGGSFLAALWRLFARRPLDSTAALLAAGLIVATLVNGLFLQSGPHPAPLMAPARNVGVLRETTGSLMAVPRPREAEPSAQENERGDGKRSRVQVLTDIQHELQRRGFYEGAIDGVYGSRMNAAIRDFEKAAGMRQTGEATDALLVALKKAPAKVSKAKGGKRAESPAAGQPSRRIMQLQRALTDYGYGPLKITGVYDAQTKAAVEKFERERKLPVKGQLSARLLHEVASVTGRSIE